MNLYYSIVRDQDKKSLQILLRQEIRWRELKHQIFNFRIYLKYLTRNYMQVICLEDQAFFTLIEEVVCRLQQGRDQKADKWICGEQAMALLNIKSKTTLQKLRDEGKIRFSQPQMKNILYDRDSILTYLDEHAKATF